MEIETNGYYNLNTNGVQYFPISVNVAEGGKIQSSKEVSVTENGKSYVIPDEGYNGIANVIINTDVQSDVKLQDSKDVTITSNGTSAVVPDTGFTAIKSVFVNTQVPVPESEASKSINVVENGSYTVTPTAPYESMKSVTCTVNVPIKNIQSEKSVSYNTNGDAVITPDVGYDGIGQVNVNIDVPSSKPVLKSVGGVDITANNIGEITSSTTNLRLLSYHGVLFNHWDNHHIFEIQFNDNDGSLNVSNVYKYVTFSTANDMYLDVTFNGVSSYMFYVNKSDIKAVADFWFDFNILNIDWSVMA